MAPLRKLWKQTWLSENRQRFFRACYIARESALITSIWQELKSRLGEWESFIVEEDEDEELGGSRGRGRRRKKKKKEGTATSEWRFLWKKLYSSDINIP